MVWKAKWIKTVDDKGDIASIFGAAFSIKKEVAKARLFITAMGTYEAALNGERIGDFVLAPGWTDYYHRLQYQEYDVTALLENNNEISVMVGKGWYRSPMPWKAMAFQLGLMERPSGLLAQLEISYIDGTTETIVTDENWKVSQSQVRFSEIYDGEIYDATYIPKIDEPVSVFDGPYETLIPQQGAKILEQERLCVAKLFTTPKGEVVLDFGQEITGYVEISLTAKAGEMVKLSPAEVMDKDGNFYNENYRDAKALYHYTCQDGEQTWHPKLTFYGFRYIRIDEFPGGANNAKPMNFTAVAIYSDMKRTGYIKTSNPLLNRLFDNILWGQKGNFVDVPTDCPQRDERLGWTGDAQVFARAACYNFDCEQFYAKWLSDMAISQREDGYIGQVIPDVLRARQVSAAWEDASAICPWEVYLAYGNPKILRDQFECMCKWVGYITANTENEFLWTGGDHHGDWLGLDAPTGSYKGSSRDDLIATAFYAHVTSIIIKIGKIIGEDISEYEKLYQNIVEAFRREYPTYLTQTECIMAAHFHLAEDCKAVADQLAEMVCEKGHLETGFVGTPYLLHVLSEFGHSEIAYELLLREQFPSWLYSVTKGATTIWEHWDGIMENGDFWAARMNSFNHYAYGAVADWIYGVAGGITPIEAYPGYEKVKIAPVPSEQLDWLSISFESRHGEIRSEWKKQDDFWRYEIVTPVDAIIVIDGKTIEVKKGTYYFYSPLKKGNSFIG